MRNSDRTENLCSASDDQKELPPWFFERHNFTRRRLGLGVTNLPATFTSSCSCLFGGADLFSLDGQRASLCRAGTATGQDVKRFLRTAKCLFEAGASQSLPTCTWELHDFLTSLAGPVLHSLDALWLQSLCRLPEVAAHLRRSAEDSEQEEPAPAMPGCRFKSDIWRHSDW